MERPYSGFTILFDDVLARITSHRAVNAVGTSTLFYSVQRKDFYLEFAKLLYANEEGLYYGGQEFLHQIYCCIGGKVSFPDVPTIYRDLTLGYEMSQFGRHPILIRTRILE